MHSIVVTKSLSGESIQRSELRVAKSGIYRPY
jgi:hypothetical protein